MARYLDCGCWTGLMTRPPLAFKDFHLSILTSLDSVETGLGGGARWIGNVKGCSCSEFTSIPRVDISSLDTGPTPQHSDGGQWTLSLWTQNITFQTFGIQSIEK